MANYNDNIGYDSAIGYNAADNQSVGGFIGSGYWAPVKAKRQLTKKEPAKKRKRKPVKKEFDPMPSMREGVKITRLRAAMIEEEELIALVLSE